ncbi:MAG: hypothetical protein WBO34_08040 [Gammaproteobacteria bacterium]
MPRITRFPVGIRKLANENAASLQVRIGPVPYLDTVGRTRQLFDEEGIPARCPVTADRSAWRATWRHLIRRKV